MHHCSCDYSAQFSLYLDAQVGMLCTPLDNEGYCYDYFRLYLSAKLKTHNHYAPVSAHVRTPPPLQFGEQKPGM